MPAMTGALGERLQTSADPRRPSANLNPRLVDSSSLGFCGGLAGGEDCVESAEGATVPEACLSACRELPPSLPSPATFTRVLARRKPTTRQAVFLAWVVERRGRPGEGSHRAGKPRRQPCRQTKPLKAVPVVSAGAGQRGLT